MRKNNRAENILIALAKYKFLTYNQMIRLGIGKHSSNLSTDFKFLMDRRRPLATKFEKRYSTDTVRHYLTKYGMKYLVDTLDWKESGIKYLLKILKKDNQQVDHRTATIDCQIGLDIACRTKKAQVLFCDTYFDKVDKNPFNKKYKSKTAILMDKNKTLKADLVFMLQTTKQKELYFLEFENGNDTKKACDKCLNFGKAIHFGQANKKYNFNKGFRTLWVFEDSSTMKNTISRLSKNTYFDKLTEYFLFKTIESIQIEDFFSNWKNIKSEKRKLFYK